MSVEELIEELKKQPNKRVPVVVIANRHKGEADRVRWTGGTVEIEGE